MIEMNDDEQDFFIERVEIMIHDGGLAEKEARAAAYKRIEIKRTLAGDATKARQ